MTVLIDTHVLLWAVDDPHKLSIRARALLEDPSTAVLVSAATAWEIAIKVSLGKLQAPALVNDFERQLAKLGFAEEPITSRHAIRAGLLPLHHRDPFDRLLIAQAQSLNVPLLSADPIFDRYDVKRLW